MFWGTILRPIRNILKPAESTIIGIDVGTTKIAAVVAKVDSEGPKTLGMASIPFNGVLWTDHNKVIRTAEVIRSVVNEACKATGCSVKSSVIGISGGATGKNSIGVIHNNRQVSLRDLQRAVSASANMIIQEDLVILDQVVNSFTLDGFERIKDPLDNTCSSLEALTHNIICRQSVLNTVTASCKMAGLNIKKFTGSELASTSICLSMDDKKKGVCFLDIGGEYTSVIVYVSGKLRYTSSVPWAGSYLTSCIGLMLGLDKITAEKVKIAFSNNEKKSNYSKHNFALRSLLDKKLRELCALLNYELDKIGLKDHLGAGIVLTGGTSKLPGLSKIFECGFGLPVRRSELQDAGWLKGVPSEYTSAVGLILHGYKAS